MGAALFGFASVEDRVTAPEDEEVISVNVSNVWHAGILRPIRLIAIVVWLATPAVFAEGPSLDFGLRAGRPQTAVVDVQRNQYFPVFGGSDFVEDPGYTVGPTIRVNLTSRLGIQLDALYKPVRFTTTTTTPTGSGLESTRAKWWEFPLTARWRFSEKEVQPFVNGGMSFNWVRGETAGSGVSVSTGQASSYTTPFRLDRSPVGFVAGGGVDLRAWRLRISPELRYTYWKTSSSQPGKYAWPNQFDILIGITFHARNDRPTSP